MAALTLAVFSAAAGVAILWVFKICSNQSALRTARRRMRAHLLAMRLYGDDPAVILRSQGRLIAWNARYLALLLPPFLVVALPLYFAWDHLDAVWGRAPLAPGDAFVLTARLASGAPDAQIVAPAWLTVESPAVRIADEHAMCWRVRVSRSGSGVLDVRLGSQTAQTRVEARPGLHYLPDRRSARSGPIAWLEIRYPHANVRMFGVSLHWAVWFCLISAIAALALRGVMRVTL